MISEDDVERAVNWLVATATEAAQARANREYMTEYRKSLKSMLMRERAGEPVSVQEREAYADERYIAHLDALRVAIEQDERLRWLHSAAEAKISAWQTQQRNTRTNV